MWRCFYCMSRPLLIRMMTIALYVCNRCAVSVIYYKRSDLELRWIHIGLRCNKYTKRSHEAVSKVRLDINFSWLEYSMTEYRTQSTWIRAYLLSVFNPLQQENCARSKHRCLYDCQYQLCIFCTPSSHICRKFTSIDCIVHLNTLNTIT